MAASFTFVPPDAWAKGDYRHGAHIDKGVCTIEGLAAVVGARLESYVEDGLGPAKCFGMRSDSGRQVGFEEFELSPAGGVELLVLFESGVCKRRDILDALSFFGIPEHSVSWFAPGAIDG
jgi:hypothetical protein